VRVFRIMSVIQELSEAIRNQIKEQLLEVRTCIPGIVHRYDYENQIADVQVAITRKRKNENGELENEQIPILPNVPVRHPRSEDSIIHIPIKRGDGVLVFFHDRDIDNYRISGEVSEPNSNRRHSLSDAFCLPGCFKDSSPIPIQEIDEDKIVIYHNDGKLTIGPDGSTRFGSRDSEPDNPIVLGNEAKSILERIIDILIAGNHVLTTSPGNPTAPSAATAAALIQLKIDVQTILSGSHFTSEVD
jgi:hypothetical protein